MPIRNITAWRLGVPISRCGNFPWPLVVQTWVVNVPCGTARNKVLFRGLLVRGLFIDFIDSKAPEEAGGGYRILRVCWSKRLYRRGNCR